MATKLGLYNAALRELGDIKLATLSDNTEARRALDDVYDNALQYCLEAGFWNFAIRNIQITENSDATSNFGYQYLFDKTDDWLKTAAVSTDPYMRTVLEDYADETAYWKADVTPLYVSYVSDDAAFGLDLGRWPARFTRYVELYLASLICNRIANSRTSRADLEELVKKALKEAKASDAMNNPPRRLHGVGSWVRARSGNSYRRENGQG